MSFGFSPSDLVALIAIVTKSYKGWRDACGEYSDITTSLQQLLSLIHQVQDEASNENSILTRTSQDEKALASILQSSVQVAEDLGEIIEDYRSLGPGKSREKNWSDLQKNWKRFRFGVKDLNFLRSKLQWSVNAISAHLTAAGVSALSRIELDIKALPDEIQRTIDGLASEIRAGRREGSVMTTYDDDEREVWRQFRRELIGEGMRSSLIHRFKPRIKSYLKTLAGEGLLEESQPDLEENEPDLEASQPDVVGRQPELEERQLDATHDHQASTSQDEAIENASDPAGSAVNADLNESSQKTERPSLSRFQATCVTDDEDEDEDAEPSASPFPTIFLPTKSEHLSRSSDASGQDKTSDPLPLDRLEQELLRHPVDTPTAAAAVKSFEMMQTGVSEDVATAAATPGESRSPNVAFTRHSYGRQRANHVEYATPDEYKTEVKEPRGRKREREHEQGRSSRKHGRQHAGVMGYAIPDDYMPTARGLHGHEHEQGYDSTKSVQDTPRSSSVEAVCGSRSPSSLEAVRWSRSPSPIETVYSSRGSSPTEHVRWSRSPSPVEAVCGSRERESFRPTLWPSSLPPPPLVPLTESFTHNGPGQKPGWIYNYHYVDAFGGELFGTTKCRIEPGRGS